MFNREHARGLYQKERQRKKERHNDHNFSQMFHGVIPFMILSAIFGLIRLMTRRSFTLPIFTSYLFFLKAFMNSSTSFCGGIFPFPLPAVIAVSTIGGIISNTFTLSSRSEEHTSELQSLIR